MRCGDVELRVAILCRERNRYRLVLFTTHTTSTDARYSANKQQANANRVLSVGRRDGQCVVSGPRNRGVSQDLKERFGGGLDRITLRHHQRDGAELEVNHALPPQSIPNRPSIGGALSGLPCEPGGDLIEAWIGDQNAAEFAADYIAKHLLKFCGSILLCLLCFGRRSGRCGEGRTH